MTVGSGLSINPAEQSSVKQNQAIAQLQQGRSNAVGTVTVTHNGVATTTTVTAPNCGPNSAVFLFPATLHAAAIIDETCVLAANVTPGQFIVTHPTTAQTDCTFWFVCLG